MKSEPRHEAFAFLSATAVPTPAMIDAMSEAELDAWLTMQGADVSGLDRRIEARRHAFAARLAARSARPAAVAPPATPSPAWAEFPFTEMFKRGWFPQFTGTLAAARAQAEPLVAGFIRQAIPEPVLSLQRQKVRTGGVTNPPALLAWQCRVLLLARTARRCPYAADALTPVWQAELVRLSRFADGPLRAIDHLALVGLPVIIEPHLPGTHLDGAALLSADGPVIGLTLRHNRTDNFWFVLLHELMHARHHLHAGTREDIFDDLDATGDALEQEADTLAGEALVPTTAWTKSTVLTEPTPEAINALAATLEISPALVAGKLRHETQNYRLARDLIGAGQVRPLFPHVWFDA